MQDPRDVENSVYSGADQEYDKTDAQIEQHERDPDMDRDLLLDDDDGCAFFEDQAEI